MMLRNGDNCHMANVNTLCLVFVVSIEVEMSEMTPLVDSVEVIEVKPESVVVESDIDGGG